MAEMRGRPLLYTAATLAGWTCARLAMQGDGREAPSAMPPAAAIPITSDQVAQAKTITADAFRPFLSGNAPRPRISNSRNSLIYRAPPALDPWQDGGRPSGLLSTDLVFGESKPLSTGRDTPPSNAPALWGKAGQPNIPRRWRGSLYAYSFWRFSTGGRNALAPAAQYGGSQSGLIGTIDPFGHGSPALLIRAAATPDGGEKELALGLRWKPSAGLPVSLSAERRLRVDAPDRFAAYLAGGIDAFPLADKWKLDGYGQAGYASGRGGGPFFDGQVHMMRQVSAMSSIPLSIGAGGWVGGQKGATRLDVGPTVATKVDAGLATISMRLDFRLRVAGNAAPKDGVALTVSTGF